MPSSRHGYERHKHEHGRHKHGHGLENRLPAFLQTDRAAAIALCLLTIACYFPATWAGFVWDDAAFVNAEQVQRGGGIFDIWFAPHSLTFEGHYWPLLYSTFWLEHKLWGFNPLGFHLVNLALHGIAVILLWRLLTRLQVPAAWLAAAIFAVHPVHVEAVGWVIGRKDVMAGLFSIACALAYLRFIENGRTAHYRNAVLFFIAALLSKSMPVTLPVSLLVLHWWKRGRVVAADLRRTLPLLALGLIVTIGDWWLYRGREAIALEHYSFIEQVLSAAQAVWFYVGKLIWPDNLAVIYPRWQVAADNPLDWIWLVGAIALAVGLWLGRKKLGRGALAAALFFVITLSPTLGFVEFGFMQFALVADRYQYLAAIGIIALVVGAGHIAVAANPKLLRGGQVAAVGALLALSVLTWQQAAIYRDNFTFFSHIVAHNPQARSAWYNLGIAYNKRGQAEKALAAYRTAIDQRAEHLWAYIGAGQIAMSLDDDAAAESYFTRAIEVDPTFPEALHHLGALRLQQHRNQEALELLQRVVATEPDYAKVYSGIGVAQTRLEQLEQALRSFDRALELNPGLIEARDNRKIVLEKLKRQ